MSKKNCYNDNGRNMKGQQLATEIVQRLVDQGHIAYFAGGWVRDFLMDHPSDDIDIATSASPAEVLDLFPNTVHVGIAFGVVVVAMEGHQFEVATFRQDFDYQDGRKPTRIVASTPFEDAQRRDFTINGLFYDPMTHEIHDYVNGRQDIEKGIIRTIGDPQDRFREDRLRMIRAIRFAARFQFHIDLETEEAIKQNADLLFPSVSAERIWQEFEKMSSRPHFDRAIIDLHRLGLLSVIFPELKTVDLSTIRERVAHYGEFPSKIKTSAFLLELFPGKNEDEFEELCRQLKTSNEEIRFARLLIHCKALVDREEKNGFHKQDRSIWSNFYVHADAERCLGVVAANRSQAEKGAFLEKHQLRRASLAQHIERIQKRKPLITAKEIQELGVSPGKKMGELLKAAEKISIEEDLHDTQKVIDLLRQQKDF